MKILVKRIKQGQNSTLSEIYVDDEFFCYGLEDLVRDEKIKDSTAIPTGTYRLGINTYGGMNAHYKRKFPDMHRGMIEIKEIPNFKYVYIHIGNYFSDTSGCLLVGETCWLNYGDYEVHESGKAYIRLYEMIVEVVLAGEVWLEITEVVLSRVTGNG